MTIRKTGGLFMLAIRLMKLFSDSDKDFSKLTAILGLYFQIRDDYCNLTSKEVSVNYFFKLEISKYRTPISVIGKGRSIFMLMECVHVLSLYQFQINREQTLPAIQHKLRNTFDQLAINSFITILFSVFRE